MCNENYVDLVLEFMKFEINWMKGAIEAGVSVPGLNVEEYGKGAELVPEYAALDIAEYFKFFASHHKKYLETRTPILLDFISFAMSCIEVRMAKELFMPMYIIDRPI